MTKKLKKLRTEILFRKHKERVSFYLLEFAKELMNRSVNHDNSKFGDDELDEYSKVIDVFDKCRFGTSEYSKSRDKISSVVKLHQSRNRHHPEHFPNGIDGMDLVDLLEMISDWKSATRNHDVGSTMKSSVEFCIKRYNISPQLAQIIVNTIDNFKMMEE